LVRPASSPAELHTPMDNFKPAIDLDRILFGRQLAPASPGSGPLDAGFILK
jgi:pilus assembly protein CpaC